MKSAGTSGVLWASVFLMGGVLAVGTGCGGGSSTLVNTARLVQGETQTISGRSVSTWAMVSGNTVLEAGATVPLGVFLNPPAVPGTGPAGAFATLAFPAEVQSTTYFNHFELTWQKTGHAPAFTSVPHFDLHYYAITPAEVRSVTSPDPVTPANERVPPTFVYSPAALTVPEMGRHANNPDDYVGELTAVNQIGFYNGDMTFLEQAMSPTFLSKKTNFSLPVPRPAVLGRSTQYPTKFTATYDAATDSYTFVYSDFVSIK